MKRRILLKYMLATTGCITLGSSRLVFSQDVKEVDISPIYSGPDPSVMTFTISGMNVWVIRRSEYGISKLHLNNQWLRDPSSDMSLQPTYCKNEQRSTKPNLFVVIGKCTNDDCLPEYWWPEYKNINYGNHWNGGFHCKCCGSLYDISGRVYKNMKAKTNMSIPQYYFKDDNHIVLGSDAPNKTFSRTRDRAG